MKLKRDESLDFLRGFGILLMVIGHIGFTTADIYIYAFHMPLFYMISGYLVKPDVRKKLSAHVISRAKRLLIPYFLLYVFWRTLMLQDSISGVHLHLVLFHLF